MILEDQKTIPSESIDLAWLAGIIDGEGSLGIYKARNGNRPNHWVNNITIVNSDQAILDKVEGIYKFFSIVSHKYLHDYSRKDSFSKSKPCFTVTIRKRDDTAKMLNLLLPYLVGAKKQKAVEMLAFYKEHPVQIPLERKCEFCQKVYKGHTRRFCSLECWHDLARGKNNPNYRHGKNILRVTTE